MKYLLTNIKIELTILKKFKKLEIVKKFKKDINKIGINFTSVELINLDYIIIFKIQNYIIKILKLYYYYYQIENKKKIRLYFLMMVYLSI
jgi:hypothetical protein